MLSWGLLRFARKYMSSHVYNSQFFALLMGLVGIGAGTLVGLQSAPWPSVMITLPPLVLGYMFIYKHSGYDEKKINGNIK